MLLKACHRFRNERAAAVLRRTTKRSGSWVRFFKLLDAARRTPCWYSRQADFALSAEGAYGSLQRPREQGASGYVLRAPFNDADAFIGIVKAHSFCSDDYVKEDSGVLVFLPRPSVLEEQRGITRAFSLKGPEILPFGAQRRIGRSLIFVP